MTNEPLVLAVETSGRMGSVAIATGEKMLAETHLSGPMRHISEVFPAISGLLNRFSRSLVRLSKSIYRLGRAASPA